MAEQPAQSSRVPNWPIGLSVALPVVALGFLLWWVLAFQSSPGRLAIEVGLLLSAYSVWAVGSGSLLLSTLRLKDANVELAALQAASIVIIFALILVILGFLNLFGVLPWK